MVRSRKRRESPGAGWSAEERSAMREAVRERRSRPRTGTNDGERDVLAKIAAMAPDDRALAERLHAIVRSTVPSLEPRTWYGMPAYAREGQVLCFFRNAGKFKTRYATLGFSDEATLDDGRMWATDFAITEIGDAEAERIKELLRRAVDRSSR